MLNEISTYLKVNKKETIEYIEEYAEDLENEIISQHNKEKNEDKQIKADSSDDINSLFDSLS